MEKLLALANGGLDITIQKYDFKSEWQVRVRKDDDGINLSIESTGENLADVIADVYEKWTKVTGRGAPMLALNMIEHQPDISEVMARNTSFNDEIPF